MQPSLPLLYRLLGAAGMQPRTVLEPSTDASIDDLERFRQPRTGR